MAVAASADAAAAVASAGRATAAIPAMDRGEAMGRRCSARTAAAVYRQRVASRPAGDIFLIVAWFHVSIGRSSAVMQIARFFRLS